MKTLAPLAAAAAALVCGTTFAQLPLAGPQEKQTVHTPESLTKAVEERKAAEEKGKKKSDKTEPALPVPPALDPGAPNTAEGRYLPKWVLLRNGRMQFGEVMKDSAGYLFRRDGARMRFSLMEVEAVADSKADIYRYKKNRIAPNDFDERLELAKWCLIHLMVDEAKSEANSLLTANPQYDPARKFLAKLNSKDNPVTPDANVPAGASGLAADAGGFGEDSMRMFTGQVQLILMNKCGKCHSNPRHDGDFHLSDRRKINASNTSRNFRSAESMVDLRNPGKSKLLEMAITPHGGTKITAAAFGGPNDEGYKALRKWVYMLSKNWQEAFAEPEGMPQIAQGSLPDLPARRPSISPPTKKSSAVASKMKPAPEKPGFATAAADDAPPARPSLLDAPKKASPAKKKQDEKDPLDPNAFNTTEGTGNALPPDPISDAPKPAPMPKEPMKSGGASSPSSDLYKDVFDGVPASWKNGKKGD